MISASLGGIHFPSSLIRTRPAPLASLWPSAMPSVEKPWHAAIPAITLGVRHWQWRIDHDPISR